MKTVLFVCPHGAGKSRAAAALFGWLAVPGWRAQTAGVTPQEAISPQVDDLLAGTPAVSFVDHDPPRPLEEVGPVDRVVAIDCEIAGSTSWRLSTTWPDPDVVAELRALVQRLAGELGGRTSG